MVKNKAKIYAKALAEVILAGNAEDKKVTDNFVKLLVKNGQEKKAKEILNLAEDMVLQKQGNKKIVFETARKATASQKKELDNFIKKGDITIEKINPELIAGIKIIINGSKQFDASLQSKLQKIF
jgi:F0F1-type ATP synthase delta subunit